MRRACVHMELPATYDVVKTHAAWFSSDAGNLVGGYGVLKQRELMLEQLGLPENVEVQFIEWDRVMWAVSIYVAGDGLSERYEWEPGFEPLHVSIVDGTIQWQ